MKRSLGTSGLLLITSFGVLAIASPSAKAQGNQPQAGAGQTAVPSGKPMEGCGMMVNGKMVYKNVAGKDCMVMNKPGNMMPNGVTMHSDPAVAPKQPK